MIAPLRLAPLVYLLLLAVSAMAQTPGSSVAPDERTTRIAERYKAMLRANPAEGLALDRLWKSYEERGASTELIDEYRRATEATDAAMPVWLVYGHLLRRVGSLDAADAAYGKGGALDPASPLPPLARGELANARSQPETAAHFFTDALDKLPAGDRRQSDVLLKLGAAWMAAGQGTKAAEAWEQTVEHDPANVSLRRQLAETYEKNGRSDRALVHLQFIETYGEPAERATALRDLARLHETRGEFDAARDALERGLALTARDNWLHGELETRLIRLYQRAGRLLELDARWRAAAEAAPRDLGAWLRLESLAQAQGDLVGERHWLEKLVALAPHEREYTLRLARRLADDGERAQAAALYDGLLKVHPDSLDLILARADLDLQLGQPAAAVDRIEARAARHPADESVTTPALAFFLDHHLDAAAEKLLRADVARHPDAADPALALIKFLFAQRKMGAARSALEAFVALPGDPATRAARWMQAAEVCRAQNAAADVMHAWQEAEKLQPAVPAPALAAGEYLLARGDAAAAARRFEHAAALSVGSGQPEVEHKWFAALQALDEPNRPDPPLNRRLNALEKTASDAPTSDNLLRLARWQSWAHLSEPALSAATRAVAADPANLTARQLIVDAATELHRPVEAEAQLQELIVRDPARQAVYERQLASLKLDNGDRDGAVTILTRLQQSAPGSREALSDLALAQQRADRWYDALATWERAYALPGTTPAQRDETRRSLLAASERLGQFLRAADLLRAAIDEQTDLAAKTDLFHDLAAFCHGHDLGSRLREDYEKRLAARPDDYFLLTALAELRREDGQEREAYALLQRAYYSAPDPARSLRELADRAEQLGEDAEAVGHQRRLIALPGEATAANLEKLAALEDANLEDAAVARTWEEIVAKFPRDTAVLGRAAEYFQKTEKPERARALLRDVVAIDPAAVRELQLLAGLDAQAGDLNNARDHFEQILAQSTAETADEPLVVPPDLTPSSEGATYFSGRLSLSLRAGRFGRPAPTAAVAGEERQLRLRAIEGMSRLLFASGSGSDRALDDARAAWLQRWRDAVAGGAKSEPLTAFYFAGQRDLTMELLARWTGREDALGETAVAAFIQAGLRLRGYAQLAEWTWHGPDRTLATSRGERLLGALQNFLASGGKPGPGIVAELFPDDVKVRELLWTAAQNGFAANRWYAPAAELGERVLSAATNQKAGYGVAVAEWEIYAGHPDRAREALRVSIDDPDGDSFEAGNPVFVALRDYYLCLPESERAAFVAGYLGKPHGRSGTAHAVLAAALLHGLSGDEAAARRDLDRLLAMRQLSVEPASLPPDIRRWAYLLSNGEQLQAWNLHSLAIHLWRHALGEAGAFDRQSGEMDTTVTEISRRLLSAEEATAADPLSATQALDEFVAENPDPSIRASTAGELWTDGQRPAAVRLYEGLARAEPAGIGDNWPNLYSFYESTGSGDTSERLLKSLLAGTHSLPPGTNRAELTCSLAALREKRGDDTGARRLLEHARQSLPGALPILFQLAQTYQRMGQWDAASTVWREALPLDQTHAARLGLAEVLEHGGQHADATEILRAGLKEGPDPGRTELAVRLTQVLLADQHIDQARSFASDLLNRDQLEPLPAVCAAFTAAGQAASARELLGAAVLRAREPMTRFRLQEAAAKQLSEPGMDQAAFIRAMRRLGKAAQFSEALRSEYDDLMFPLAHRQGADAWLEGELRRGWKDGKGDPAAGARLAGLALQNHRDDLLREVVQSIDRRPDLPEKLLYTLATSLVGTDHAPLALAVCERLTRRFPEKQEYVLERALALWKSERKPEADKLLDSLAESALFRDGVLEGIASFYLQREDEAHAADYLTRIAKSDPMAVRSPQAFLQLAQILLDQHRVPEAGQLLRVAYARPACDNLVPLVRYLKAAGELAGGRAVQMPGQEFPLTFTRRARLLAAVRDELVATGRGEDARRLVEAHAEFLGETPALAAEMARNATPASVGSVTGCLERALDQRSPPSANLSHLLATLYTRWAVWDANSPTTQSAKVAHLTRALELEPDDVSTAAQLAKLYVEQRQPERARQIMAAFDTPDALPSEREQAGRILSP